MKYYVIYGERCSGTNYLEELIKLNVDKIEHVDSYGHKHFFGFQKFEKNDNEDNTLFFCIIREPISWLYSLYCNGHHIPKKNRTLPEFLINKFESEFDDKIISKFDSKDYNYITKKPYKNIFELRKYKNYYFTDVLPTLVKNCVLIKYEDLVSNPEKIFNDLKHKYNLTLKNDVFKNVDYYMANKNIKFTPRKGEFEKQYLDIIYNNIDIKQENQLGYLI
jgi:hypothetical protein